MTYQPKWKRYYQPSATINTANHFALGFVWKIQGSAKEPYEVEMHKEGWSCNCMAFYTKKKCKHCTSVDQSFDDFDEIYEIPRL